MRQQHPFGRGNGRLGERTDPDRGLGALQRRRKGRRDNAPLRLRRKATRRPRRLDRQRALIDHQCIRGSILRKVAAGIERKDRTLGRRRKRIVQRIAVTQDGVPAMFCRPGTDQQSGHRPPARRTRRQPGRDAHRTVGTLVPGHRRGHGRTLQQRIEIVNAIRSRPFLAQTPRRIEGKRRSGEITGRQTDWGNVAEMQMPERRAQKRLGLQRNEMPLHPRHGIGLALGQEPTDGRRPLIVN